MSNKQEPGNGYRTLIDMIQSAGVSIAVFVPARGSVELIVT